MPQIVKKPYQNLSQKTALEGQVFRVPGDDTCIFKREGNSIIAYSLAELMGYDGNKPQYEHISSIVAKAKTKLKSDYGIEFSSLPAYELGEAASALGVVPQGGSWANFSYTPIEDRTETVSDNIDPDNPHRTIRTSGDVNTSPENYLQNLQGGKYNNSLPTTQAVQISQPQSIYVTENGTDVYDIGSGTPRYVSFEEASQNNIWSQVKKVDSLQKASQDAATVINAINTGDQTEIEIAQKKWADYYGYPLDLNQPVIRYPEELAEYEKEVTTAKQRLLEDYNRYLDDLNTGKVRAGTDYQKQLANALEQKTQWITQQDMTIKQQKDTINRNWISKGGLFSGVRAEDVQNYQAQQDLARQQYMTTYNYNQDTQKTQYERAMEDYQKKQLLLEQTKQRGEEDIALQRIKDIRSLQESYQKAISASAKDELSKQYGGTNL